MLGLVAILASASASQSAPTTFTSRGADKGQTVLTKTLDVINLTIDSFKPGPRSGADGDKLELYCVRSWSPCNQAPQETYSSLQTTFDTMVKRLTYNVTYVILTDNSSTTYLQEALQSVQDNASGMGLKTFNNQFAAAANAPILVSTIDL